MNSKQDEYWMAQALQQARQAAKLDEVPVGAVLVGSNDELIVAGHNQPISTNDPTAHAEVVVLRQAASLVKNYRLPETTLYVTLEPCTMCVGALVQARVKRIVYGANEPKTGAVESSQKLFETANFNHTPTIQAGVLAEECAGLLSDFFSAKREKKRALKEGS